MIVVMCVVVVVEGAVVMGVVWLCFCGGGGCGVVLGVVVG